MSVPPESERRSAPFVALAVTLGVQAVAAFALAAPSVLAPDYAQAFGMRAQHVGWLVSIAYLGAMTSGLLCGGLSRSFGPVRLSQWALVSAGASLALYPVAQAWVLLVAAVILGVGYGLPNPTAAEILARHAPLARRGLFFSIKQTGVPLGIALAGLSIPAMLAVLDWRQTNWVLGGLMAAAAIPVGMARRVLEPNDRVPAAGVSPARADDREGLRAVLVASLLRPLRTVLGHPQMRLLGLASLGFAATQITYLSFLVALLKLEHELSLAAAAGVLSVSQAVSMVARIGWGHVSDRWVDPTRLLGALGVSMALSVVALGLAPPDTPASLMLLIALCCAATAVAWNGVYYADLVRHVPAGNVAGITGASQFFTFFGGVGGGALFAGMVSVFGSYSAAYCVIALLPGFTGVLLLRAHSRRSATIRG